MIRLVIGRIAGQENSRLMALAAVLSVLALTSCIFGGGTDDDEEEPGVWVLNVIVGLGSLEEFTVSQDGVADVTFFVTVAAEACDAATLSDGRYTDCGPQIERLVSTVDPGALSSNGNLRIRLERETVALVDRPNSLRLEGQYVPEGDPVSFAIGPIMFGESQRFGPITFRPEAGADGARRAGPESERLADHRIVVEVSQCHLSNGSACGNDLQRVPIIVRTVAEATATAEAAPGATATSAIGSSSSGLAPEGSGFTELVPNDNDLVFGGVNEVVIDASRRSGRFNLEWWFAANPQTVFTTSGTLNISTSDGNGLAGAFFLDEPRGNSLAFQLGDDGSWSASVDGNSATGALMMSSGGELRFSAELQ